MTIGQMTIGQMTIGQMTIAFHATKLPFRRPKRRRTPPQLLVARAPTRHPLRLGLQPRHHALDQVGGLEAHAQLGKDVQPVEREGLLKPFRETRRGRFVQLRHVTYRSCELTAALFRASARRFARPASCDAGSPALRRAQRLGVVLLGTNPDAAHKAASGRSHAPSRAPFSPSTSFMSPPTHRAPARSGSPSPRGHFAAPEHETGVPPLVELPRLLAATDRFLSYDESAV